MNTDIYVDGYLNQDDSGPHGMDSALAEMVMDELGYKMEWIQIPQGNDYFESIRDALNTDEIDMFISVTSIKPERTDKVLFSIPYTFQDGDNIAISFKTGNTRLKNEVDILIEKYLQDGTIEKLKEKYIYPVHDILETNNTMRTLSHKFKFSNLILNGKKADSKVDIIAISYDKYWREIDKNGKLFNLARIIRVNYGDIEIKWLEETDRGGKVGSTTVYHFDQQFLEENGWATFDVLSSEGHKWGTVDLRRMD